MIAILGLSAVFLGFACLCLAMDRHQRDFIGRRLSSSAVLGLRFGGFSSITFGLVVAIGALGWGYGIALWFGLLTIGAIPVVALLSTWSSRAKR